MLQEACEIPTQDSPPNPFGSNGNETGHTFFFTHQHNMTVNQTVYTNSFNSRANGFSDMMSLKWVVVVLGAMVASATYQEGP